MRALSAVSFGFLILSITAPAASDQRLAASSQVFWVLADGRLVASGDARPMRGDAGEEERNHFEAIAGLPEVRAVAISSGGDGAAALDEQGQIWLWGRDWCRHLRDSADCEGESHVPVLLPGVQGVKAISLGDRHLIALTAERKVLTYGLAYGNEYGQLGAGDTEDHAEVVEVEGMTGVVEVAAGESLSLLLRSDGTVWGMGLGNSGLLGTNARQGESPYERADAEKHSNVLPIRVEGLRDIASIALGEDFALALDESGAVWGWGDNRSWQLGLRAGALASFPPGRIPGLTSIVAIAAGYDFTLALRDDGHVLALGNNVYGTLGDRSGETAGMLRVIDGLSSVEAVYAGHYNAFASLADGRFVGWGGNSFHPTSETSTLAPTELDAELRPKPPSAVVAGGGAALWITNELHVDQVSERVEVLVEGTSLGVLDVGPERSDHELRIDLPAGVHPYRLKGKARMDDGRRRLTGGGLLVIVPRPMTRRFAEAAAQGGLIEAIREVRDAFEPHVPGVLTGHLRLWSEGPMDEETLSRIERRMGHRLPASYRQALLRLGPFGLGAAGAPFPPLALYPPDPERTLAAWVDRGLALGKSDGADPWSREVSWAFDDLRRSVDAAPYLEALRRSLKQGWIGAISGLGTYVVRAGEPRCDDGSAGALWPQNVPESDIDQLTGDDRFFLWRDDVECDLDVVEVLGEQIEQWLDATYIEAGLVFLTADPSGEPLWLEVERVDDGDDGDDGETLELRLAGSNWWG